MTTMTPAGVARRVLGALEHLDVDRMTRWPLPEGALRSMDLFEAIGAGSLGPRLVLSADRRVPLDLHGPPARPSAEWLANDHALVVANIDRLADPFRSIVEHMEDQLGLLLQASVTATAGTALTPRIEATPALTVQVQGRRQVVHEAAPATPERVELEAGLALWIPRGRRVHSLTTDRPSSWFDVVPRHGDPTPVGRAPEHVSNVVMCLEDPSDRRLRYRAWCPAPLMDAACRLAGPENGRTIHVLLDRASEPEEATFDDLASVATADSLAEHVRLLVRHRLLEVLR